MKRRIKGERKVRSRKKRRRRKKQAPLTTIQSLATSLPQKSGLWRRRGAVEAAVVVAVAVVVVEEVFKSRVEEAG